MPMTLAWATASQAAHIITRPPARRTGWGIFDHAGTPLRKAHAPASTQKAPKKVQSAG